MGTCRRAGAVAEGQPAPGTGRTGRSKHFPGREGPPGSVPPLALGSCSTNPEEGGATAHRPGPGFAWAGSTWHYQDRKDDPNRPGARRKGNSLAEGESQAHWGVTTGEDGLPCCPCVPAE